VKARFGLVALLALAGCNTLPAATPEQVAAYQGTYSGEAVLPDAAMPGPVCQPRIRITGFHVVGNQVEFGVFSGTIRNDGSLEMFNRQDTILGHFEGMGQFNGELIVPPTEVCRYRLSLSRDG
jgi:hypothetical protein